MQDHCKEFRRLYRVLSSCFPNYRKGGEGKEKKKMENEEGKINDKIIFKKKFYDPFQIIKK